MQKKTGRQIFMVTLAVSVFVTLSVCWEGEGILTLIYGKVEEDVMRDSLI
jgi:Na+-driven multidrug efflux pump